MNEGNYEEFTDQNGYVNCNPQQEGMVLFEYIISLISRKYMGILVQFLNIVALIIAFYAIYKITEIMFNNKNLACITYICLLIFLPIFFYITFMYGNLFGLACSMIAVLFELKYFKQKKWWYISISGFGITLAIIFKSNYLVTCIAMILMFIVNLIEKKKLKNLLAVVAILVIYLCSNTLVKTYINKATGAEIEDGIPMVAYVAMGMQESNKAPGWYNGYNRYVYRTSGYDTEIATQSSIKEIKKRVKVFIQNPKYAIDFYVKKIVSQWNNPTFQGIWVNKGRKSKVNRPSYVNSVIGTGIVNRTITEYMNIIQTLILFGATAYIILDYKKAKGSKLFFIIIFIGGFLFHLVWEAKCQYTVTYFILLIPYCVKGYDLLTEKVKEKIEHKKIKKHNLLEEKFEKESIKN